MPTKKTILTATVAIILAGGFSPLPWLHGWNIARAVAGENWQQEFEAVCAKTDDPMSLSSEELRGFLARLDKLLPVVDKLDESTRKVYLKRIRSCRNLYAFVLESKDQKVEK